MLGVQIRCQIVESLPMRAAHISALANVGPLMARSTRAKEVRVSLMDTMLQAAVILNLNTRRVLHHIDANAVVLSSTRRTPTAQ